MNQNPSKEQINEFLKNNPGSNYVRTQGEPGEPTPEEKTEMEKIKLQKQQAEAWRLQGYNLANKINGRAYNGQPFYCWDYENLIKDSPKMLIVEIGGKEDKTLKILKEAADLPDLTLSGFKPLDLDTAQTEYRLKENFKELENLKNAGYYSEAETKQRVIDQRKKRIDFNNSRKADIEGDAVGESINYIETQNNLIKFLQEQIKQAEAGIKEVEKFLKVYDTPEKASERVKLRVAYSKK